MKLIQKAGLIGVALLVVVVSFGTGLYMGYSQRPAIDQVIALYNKETAKPADIDFSPFWKAWSLLEEKYVASDGLDRQKMVYGAISGMVDALEDPYTVFFPPAEKELFDSEIEGKFEGIGAEIGMRKGILIIVSPLTGSPAAAAGLLAGDKIVKIDDTVTSDLTIDEAVRLIRGEKDTIVSLTILRNGEEETRVVKITRDTIRIPILDMEKRDGGIFIIQLHNFSEQSPFEFRNALQEMARSGSNKLVLDVRNNPGGFLEASVDIASWFLESGKVVAREAFGDGTETQHRSRGYNALGDIPTVILMNNGSASASEILAGALRDHLGTQLIGTKTFGKGSVQELVDVTEDTSLKITIARWLTPSGVSISEQGLEPDIVVENSPEDTEESRDPQLEKALEILRGME
ncbi:MAG: Carboxy-terminal-processing protease [Parcubacteria group bacterium Gr01-1014_70]|nr:MAG: Carboxy-terminal-processing protease [Parcubacteria group bacterium Gr01-1014_70]